MAEYTKENLVQTAKAIRDEFRAGANTAYRVGSLLLAMIERGADIDDLRKYFISKDKSDRTDHNLGVGGELTVDGPIKALTKLEVGEAIDSLIAGKDIIAENGKIQADRMELRKSLTVLEIIFNRLSAQEEDTSFSESGIIESVENMGEETFRLTLRKRWENDFTALKENDIIYGVVNNLASGSGEYYTSWLRVLSVNTTANTVTAVMYDDNEVPGGVNYAPEKLMIVVHRGNPVDEDRQAYWYLSSREKCICMLDGVTKPILKENNYAVIIGKLKELSLFDNLPINYRQSYVYARGIALQDVLKLTYNGGVVRVENFRGRWNPYTASAEPYQSSTTSFDSVYHYGCKWACLSANTAEEPEWNSSDWAMIEGNPEFTVDINSTNGWNLSLDNRDSNGNIIDMITAFVLTGRIYNRDVTDGILDADVEWTRDTGDVAEDNAWAVKRAGAGKSLTIKQDDLGVNFTTIGYCKFKGKAYLRDGEETYSAETEVTL